MAGPIYSKLMAAPFLLPIFHYHKSSTFLDVLQTSYPLVPLPLPYYAQLIFFSFHIAFLNLHSKQRIGLGHETHDESTS